MNRLQQFKANIGNVDAGWRGLVATGLVVVIPALTLIGLILVLGFLWDVSAVLGTAAIAVVLWATFCIASRGKDPSPRPEQRTVALPDPRHDDFVFREIVRLLISTTPDRADRYDDDGHYRDAVDTLVADTMRRFDPLEGFTVTERPLPCCGRTST